MAAAELSLAAAELVWDFARRGISPYWSFAE
jgi:hypothetical protein